MSRGATPATRNEATPHVKPPKVTPSAELTIGMGMWSSRGRFCGRLRTVANGCGRKHVERTHPRTPRVKREPLRRIWEKHAIRHIWSAALATQNGDGRVQSAAPARKTATHLLKTSLKYCAGQNDFRHVTKHVWMSRSATPAMRNEATPFVKPPKATPFCRTYQNAIGTAIWGSRGRLRTVADGCGRLRTVADGSGRFRTVADGCGRLRTVADGCGRLRTVADGCGRLRTVADGCGRLRTVADGCGRLRTVADGWATSSEHTLNPQIPRVNRESLLRIPEKNAVFCEFATFSRTCIFFLLILSLLWSSLFCSSLLWLFPPLPFHLSILSEVWLLNFFRWCATLPRLVWSYMFCGSALDEGLKMTEPLFLTFVQWLVSLRDGSGWAETRHWHLHLGWWLRRALRDDKRWAEGLYQCAVSGFVDVHPGVTPFELWSSFGSSCLECRSVTDRGRIGFCSMPRLQNMLPLPLLPI